MNEAITDISHAEKLGQISRTKSFLGREFLTWLWYFIDSNSESAIKVTHSNNSTPLHVTLWVDDKIVLDSNSGSGHQHVMRGGDPSQSPEASVALATGKTVRELKLGMNIHGVGDFSTNLNASDQNPRSIQLPGDDNLGDTEDVSFLPAHQRIKQTTLLLNVIDYLFGKFIEERISDKWLDDSQSDIKEWIVSRSAQVTNSMNHIIH